LPSRKGARLQCGKLVALRTFSSRQPAVVFHQPHRRISQLPVAVSAKGRPAMPVPEVQGSGLFASQGAPTSRSAAGRQRLFLIVGTNPVNCMSSALLKSLSQQTPGEDRSLRLGQDSDPRNSGGRAPASNAVINACSDLAGFNRRVRSRKFSKLLRVFLIMTRNV